MKFLRRAFNYPLTLTALILVACNAIFFAVNPLKSVDPESLPSSHSWIWWSVQDFKKETPPPPVVILGSSLMLQPIIRVDSDVSGKTFDLVDHHYSQYLQSNLEALLNQKNLRCFDFAQPGASLSDDYMIMRNMLTGDKKPKLVILGVALRDMMDSNIRFPGTTQTFRCLKRIAPIDDLVELAYPKLWDRWDYVFGKLSYIYAKKLDIQTISAHYFQTAFAPLAGQLFSPSKLNNIDLSRYVPSMRSELEKGDLVITPNFPEAHLDNTREYISRYRNLRTGNAAQQSALQLKFLTKLLELCRDQGTEVVIVNMPLSKKNLDLMPPGVYQEYLTNLKSYVRSQDCPFLDINSDKLFSQADFLDTCHLGSPAGRRVLDILAKHIGEDSRLARSLSSEKSQLATHGTMWR